MLLHSGMAHPIQELLETKMELLVLKQLKSFWKPAQDINAKKVYLSLT